MYKLKNVSLDESSTLYEWAHNEYDKNECRDYVIKYFYNWDILDEDGTEYNAAWEYLSFRSWFDEEIRIKTLMVLNKNSNISQSFFLDGDFVNKILEYFI